MPHADLAGQLAAHAAGQICAVAVDVQRDLHRCVARYPHLYPSDIFDASVLSAIALATCFAAPWLSAAQQRPVSRAALWTFALDRWVDAQAASASAVTQLRRDAVALVRRPPGPAPAGGQLLEFLAAIHDGLRRQPDYRRLRHVWWLRLGQLFDAMARERAWLERGRRPGVRAYLANSDSLALRFVFATHLVCVGAPPGLRLDRLWRAVGLAQRALRLTNDLATYERDRRVGDLNVLELGLCPAQARAEAARLARSSRQLLLALRPSLPGLAIQVQRQLDYNLGFYARGDYWGVDPR